MQRKTDRGSACDNIIDRHEPILFYIYFVLHRRRQAIINLFIGTGGRVGVTWVGWLQVVVAGGERAVTIGVDNNNL